MNGSIPPYAFMVCTGTMRPLNKHYRIFLSSQKFTSPLRRSNYIFKTLFWQYNIFSFLTALVVLKRLPSSGIRRCAMLDITLAFLTYCSIRLQGKHVGLRFCSEDGAAILPKRRLLPIRLHGITFQKTITCIRRENLMHYCRLRNLFTLPNLAQGQLGPTLIRSRWQLMTRVLDCMQPNRK